MKHSGKISSMLQRFMAGRYGADQFSRFLSVVSCVLILVSVFARSAAEGRLSSLLASLGFALLVWCYFRTLSRKSEQRRKENYRYLTIRSKVTGWFQFQRDRFRQRKDYVFFHCPGCRNIVRVPRHKGHIRITCRQCGYTFEKKT